LTRLHSPPAGRAWQDDALPSVRLGLLHGRRLHGIRGAILLQSPHYGNW